MKLITLLKGSLASLFFCLFLSEISLAQERKYSLLNEDWSFSQNEQIDAPDANWEKVQIPHDWAIKGPFIIDGNGNTGKLPWKGQAWYKKEIELKKKDKIYYLIFDGVMAFPEVFVNNELAGKWDYGYNSFYLDVTDFLKDGKNEIAVHVNTENHDSRWYPGAGIYRKVQLLEVNKTHGEIWGTAIRTPIIKPNYADVRIRTKILNQNDEAKKVGYTSEIFNEKGESIVADTKEIEIRANAYAYAELNIQVMNPVLWDIENPHLYTAKISIMGDGKVLDEFEEQFGIRSIRFTSNDGFYLNDRRIQLKGVNLHHDHGPLGAAFYPRAMERQLEIMKDMGVNAIRNSHNTAAPELLQMCDEMGLLFFNEVFDKYDGKADITDTTDFENFTFRNIRNFVKRDRNHPSIFLWSVGNEIPDVQTNQDGGQWKLHTMVNYVRKFDPDRPITLVNDAQDAAATRHFDYYDVHAWNYNRRYRLARKLEPEKSVVISESASTLSTRGFYELPLPEKKTDFTKSLQVSSYDLHAPWWAEIADDDFMWQQDESYVAGEFVWTGFDYLGEPTPYFNSAVKEMGMTDKEASRSSYFGIVDLVGIPKDRFYLYKSYWRPDVNTTHILPHWNWEGSKHKIVPVFVYTNGDCAELFLNGKSQGKKCKDPDSDNSVDRFRLMWNDVEYAKGELKAISYRNGKKIHENTLKTAGPAHHLVLSPDRKIIQADGMDLSYIMVEAYDKNGIPHPLAMDELSVKVSGGAELIGVGNGNPQSFDSFASDKVKLFYGKAMIIVKAGKVPSKVDISVESDKLGKAKTRIEVK